MRGGWADVESTSKVVSGNGHLERSVKEEKGAEESIVNVAVLRGCPLCLFVLFLCFHVILDDVSSVSAMRQAFYAIGSRMGKKDFGFRCRKKRISECHADPGESTKRHRKKHLLGDRRSAHPCLDFCLKRFYMGKLSTMDRYRPAAMANLRRRPSNGSDPSQTAGLLCAISRVDSHPCPP